MIKNKNRNIGIFIGFVLGLIPTYFSFAIIFALAEEGKFNIIALFIPVFVLILFSFFGWLTEKIIRKIIKK